MKTRIMFIKDTEPLVGARVETSVGKELVTDAQGQIELDLAPGPHAFRVMRDSETWAERTIDTRTTSASLLVINVSSSTDPAAEVAQTLIGDSRGQLLESSGRYEYKRILGQGGMGVVFKAYDKLLERDVAIKVLNEELRHNNEAQRIFLAEARSLATLKHPNLVTVHDVTTIDNVAMIVTEFVAGQNLEEYVRLNGGMDEDAVIKIAHQLAQALSYMHERGMIHRDIKPGNLIIREDGSLKVIDFGLARSLEQIMIRGTRRRGTPAYMAPEQIEGGELTARTDLYQVGITLYELLSSYLPFESSDMAYAHVHMAPRPIADLVPNVSFGLARLIEDCLAKDPAARPEGAAALIPPLERLRAAGMGDATAELRVIGIGSPNFSQTQPGADDVDPSLQGLEASVKIGNVTNFEDESILLSNPDIVETSEPEDIEDEWTIQQNTSHRKYGILVLASLAVMFVAAGALALWQLFDRAGDGSSEVFEVASMSGDAEGITPVVMTPEAVRKSDVKIAPSPTPIPTTQTLPARDLASAEGRGEEDGEAEGATPVPVTTSDAAKKPDLSPAQNADAERPDPPEKSPPEAKGKSGVKSPKSSRASARKQAEEEPSVVAKEEVEPEKSKAQADPVISPKESASISTEPTPAAKAEEVAEKEEDDEEVEKRVIRKRVIRKKTVKKRKIPRSF